MKAIFLTLRVVGLVAIHFLCFIFIAAALLPRPADEPTVNASAAVVGVLLVSVLNTIVLSYIILRSTLPRWNLVLPLFIILYGVMTVLPQIETASSSISHQECYRGSSFLVQFSRRFFPCLLS